MFNQFLKRKKKPQDTIASYYNREDTNQVSVSNEPLPNNNTDILVLNNEHQINKKRILFSLIPVLFLILVLGFILVSVLNKPKIVPIPIAPQPITLRIWEYTENSDHFQKLINDYHSKNPLINVVFEQRDPITYKTDLEQRLKSNSINLPDILELDSKNINLYKSYLSSAPTSVYTSEEYNQLYYSHMVRDNVFSQSIYGVPTGNDGLILAYNTDLVKTETPTYWLEFINLVNSLTTPDTKNYGTNKINGIAASSSKSMNYLPEILQLLIFQNKQNDFYDLDGNIHLPFTNTSDAINLYQRLIAKTPWDSKATSSLQAFTAGNTAFAFIKAKDIYTIQSKNSKLNFKTTLIPIISDQKYWSSYTSLSVSNISSNTKEAWKLIKYLSSEDSVKYLYQSAADFNLSKKPYAFKSLSQDLKSDNLYTPIGVMAPNMITWNSPDYDQTNKIFLNLIQQNSNNILSKDNIDLLNTNLNNVLINPSFQ